MARDGQKTSVARARRGPIRRVFAHDVWAGQCAAEKEGGMKIYGLKTCDTCRKAVKALEGRGAVLVDIRAEPLDAATRARFLDTFGEALVNRRSTTWKGLSETERADAPETLLAAHPALMKRPVIEDGDRLYLGWDAGVRAALGL
jgi:arsenate reductase-like glutaredoxin family protein